MNQKLPKDTGQVIRDAFYDMALSLECLFLLYGTSDLFAEDVVRCLEEGYTDTMKHLKKVNGPKGKLRRQTAVTRFLSRLEQEKHEKTDRGLSGGGISMKGGSAMKVQKYPVAPEPAAERMVLGRMVLRIEDSGRAVLEAMLPHNAVSADAAHQPAAPDENPNQGAEDSTSGKRI